MRSALGLVWSAAAGVGAPAVRAMLRRRVSRGREIAARLPERFGVGGAARPAGRLLWLHAASVGECLSVLPVLPLLPGDVHVLFTTGTVTSARLLASRLKGEEAGAFPGGLAGRVTHRFVPLDVPRWVSAFLDHWRPDAACFVESELWPNLLAGCRARGTPLGLVNARLSARSARRWRLAGGLFREMLGGFRWIAAQTAGDAARLAALGGADVVAVGNLKQAAGPLPVDEAELQRLRGRLGGRPAWVAASTHPGDEAVAGRVHAALLGRFPDLLTIVAPRHPERGAAVAALLGGAPRRSLGEDFAAGGGVWACDTLGELGLLYRLAPVVFLGKSFGEGGGQNPLEPARLGCAVATGPATANFAEAVGLLADAGGLCVVADAAALAAWVAPMLGDPQRREAQGAAALAAAGAGGDLPARIAGLMAELLP